MVYFFTLVIFILAGGPFIETTHNKVGFTAPLTAITAAVVGVILNLALFFIWHSVWGPSGFDPWSAAVALGAAGLLFRYKWKLTWVLAAAAAVGLIVHIAGAVRRRMRLGGNGQRPVSAQPDRGPSGRGAFAGGPRQRVAVEFQLVAQRPAAQLAGVKQSRRVERLFHRHDVGTNHALFAVLNLQHVGVVNLDVVVADAS